MTSSFDAVLFDLDGVLVDSEGLSNRVLHALFSGHGLTLSELEFRARAVGSTFAALYALLERDFGWTPPDGFDARIDAELADAFRDVAEIPGAADTLRALGAAGVKFAVASNSRRDRLHLKLAAAGLAPLVGEHAYDGAHVNGRGKPLPDLYLFAARQLGADPARCLVVEDSVPGARAGVDAGATVWGLLAGDHVGPSLEAELRAAGVHRIVHDHAELRAALALPGSLNL